MKRNRLKMIGLAAGALMMASLGPVQADVSPYDVIAKRNPFNLKDPPPPPDPNEAAAKAPPPAPPATVELTGITSILSSKRALLEIVPGPGKPMIKPILAEGERIESVEVVSINVEKNEVTVKNGLLITNLTFKVAKSGPTPLPAGAPGTVPPPVPPVRPSSAAATPNSYNNQNATQLGTGRNNVMMGGGNTVAPATGSPAYGGVPSYNGAVNPALGNPAAVGTDGNLRTIPSRNIRATPQEAAVNRDELFQRMEEQRLINEAINQTAPQGSRGGRGPVLPPLPPTPYTPPDAPGAPLPPMPGR